MSDIFADWSFGGVLKRYRLSREIGLREMSRLLDTDPAAYCNLERSRIAPPKTYHAIKDLVEPLNLSDSEFEFLLVAAFNFHFHRLHERFLRPKPTSEVKE